MFSRIAAIARTAIITARDTAIGVVLGCPLRRVGFVACLISETRTRLGAGIPFVACSDLRNARNAEVACSAAAVALRALAVVAAIVMRGSGGALELFAEA